MKTVNQLTFYIFVFVTVIIYLNIFTSTPSKKSVTYNKFDTTDSKYNLTDRITTYKWFKTMKHRFQDLGEEDRPKYGYKTRVCNLNISTLGPISVNKTKLKLKWVEEKYPEIRGGFYAPTNCRARHRVAILVPYRNRERNLILFLNHMHTFLKKQLLEYRIFVIEQNGTKKFNKGSLYNVGFLEAQRFGKWNCMVFHDVDLLPLDERILYSCPRAPTHMSAAVETYNYELLYSKLFGGVTALTVAHFERVNGYSNLYWGWGAEDDDILQAKRFPMLRYNRSIARYAALPHKRNCRNPKRGYFLSFAKKRFRNEGLSSVQYILVNATKKKLFTHILADINPFNFNVK